MRFVRKARVSSTGLATLYLGYLAEVGRNNFNRRLHGFLNLYFLLRTAKPPRPRIKNVAGSGVCIAIKVGPLKPDAKTVPFPLESNFSIVPLP